MTILTGSIQKDTNTGEIKGNFGGSGADRMAKFSDIPDVSGFATQADLEIEEAARIASDIILQDDIDTEVNNRVAADVVLQGEIDDINDIILSEFKTIYGTDVAWTNNTTYVNANLAGKVYEIFVVGNTVSGGTSYTTTILRQDGTSPQVVINPAGGFTLQTGYEAQTGDQFLIQGVGVKPAPINPLPVSVLPLASTSGDPLWWAPTGEKASFSSALNTFVLNGDVPLATLFDNFIGLSGVQIRDRPVKGFRLLKTTGYEVLNQYWRLHAGTWQLNGSGYAVPTAPIATADTSLLRTCMLAPSGISGDKIIRTTFIAGSGFFGIVIASGRYFIRCQVQAAKMQIFEFDAFAHAPPFTTSSDFVQLAISATLTSYTANTDQEYIITVAGQLITMLHVPSGISVSATATIPIGSEVGASTNSTTNSAIKRIAVYPMSRVAASPIGNGLNMLNIRLEKYLYDNDAIGAGMDITGNGLPDIPIASCSNGNGNAAQIGFMEQVTEGEFIFREIDQNPVSMTTRFEKAQTVAFVPINGVPHFFVSDQTAYVQWLYYPVNKQNLRGLWSDGTTYERIQIDTFKRGRTLRVMDINGIPTIIFGFEGNTGTTLIGAGGIVAWPIPTTNVYDPATWSAARKTIVRNRGSWGMIVNQQELVDLDEDGVAEALIFSARKSPSQTNGVSGVYAIAPADITDPWAAEWVKTTLFDGTTDDYDVTNIDIGDFSGDGNGLDIAFVRYRQWMAGVHTDIPAEPLYLRFSTGWTVENFSGVIGIAAANNLNAIYTAPSNGKNRDAIYAWVAYQALYYIYWDTVTSAWIADPVWSTRFRHQVVVPQLGKQYRTDGSVVYYMAMTAEGSDDHGMTSVRVTLD